ncbi:ATP-binding protein [Labrenzia suaedae]|uniref:ATP-binding protein n=2 Tax=Roseibium litorale TaxID=2803841 RepID=A0ABR9CJK2_9HYPH|nr:ATP-binding protein [Roseibium litorale]
MNQASGGLIALKNVARFIGLMDLLINREPHTDGIGVFHGYSGYGKTYASIYAANVQTAIRLEVGDSWSKRKFLENLLTELEIKPERKTIADMTHQAILALGDDHTRPLIIDEADQLADKGMLELVREIYMHSGVPVLLIGEEKLPAKLKKVERLDNRVLEWVPAEPCDHEDAKALADLFCPGLELADSLIELLVTLSQGRARRIVANLNKMKVYARNSRQTAFNAGSFDQSWFHTGEPPRRIVRRVA